MKSGKKRKKLFLDSVGIRTASWNQPQALTAAELNPFFSQTLPSILLDFRQFLRVTNC